MTEDKVYQPRYENSWGLVIGINSYQKASPLAYACNDAVAVAKLLEEKFGFPASNITVLTDRDAARDRIVSTYLEFTKEKVGPNDRVLVFFAGHGYTRTGARGEVGYLIPVDGTPDDLTTLIRWDELTRNAELVPAKHILFIMDACYGGLALMRYAPPGSMRFMKDMLQRYSRQVLTAGKADEVVADSGGPRPKHSIFTGHLLDALEGAASTADGILTANGVMAYVYDRVAKDYQSRQTPHYGFIDGDGDFIFDLSALNRLSSDSPTGEDILIQIPAALHPPTAAKDIPSTAEKVKEYLSDPKHRIKLDDVVTEEVRRVLSLIGDNYFPVQTTTVTPDEFAERLKRYENRVADLQTMVTLLGKWGDNEHLGILEKVFARISDINTVTGGINVWLELRWYPTLLLMYTGCIAALSAQKYDNLATILTTKVGTRHSGDTTLEVIVPVVEGILAIQRTDLFKKLPGYDRNYVPRSEYLFKVLQPPLEDLLFLGRSYEPLFDRFEVMCALIYADLTYEKRGGGIWGPIGRFGWKYTGRRFKDKEDRDPFSDVVFEAARYKDNWAPIRAGLFHGSYDRFSKIAGGYEEVIKKLNWF